MYKCFKINLESRCAQVLWVSVCWAVPGPIRLPLANQPTAGPNSRMQFASLFSIELECRSWNAEVQQQRSSTCLNVLTSISRPAGAGGPKWADLPCTPGCAQSYFECEWVKEGLRVLAQTCLVLTCRDPGTRCCKCANCAFATQLVLTVAMSVQFDESAAAIPVSSALLMVLFVPTPPEFT